LAAGGVEPPLSPGLAPVGPGVVNPVEIPAPLVRVPENGPLKAEDNQVNQGPLQAGNENPNNQQGAGGDPLKSGGFDQEIQNIVKSGGFDLVAFDKKIGPNGSIGQIDTETTNAIIEATIRPKGKLDQIKGFISNPNLNPSGKPVILYAPNYRVTPEKDITSVGGYVVRTQEELLNLLKRLGG
jgi:hypothetical protein